jgi:protein TonB
MPVYDTAPRLVEHAAPRYPAEARRKGIEGEVRVSLLVGEDGRVREVRILEASPSGIFDESAREAARSWLFEPARRGGEPVLSRVEAPIRFELE